MTASPPVDEVYDRIATHFSKTREHPWPDVAAFIEAEAGRYGLDIGCGNGRHTELLTETVDRAIGLDVSTGLLREAQRRARNRGFDAAFLRGDATVLPIGAGQIDVAVYIATIHHLRSRTARIASLDELARVLAPDGVALVSAWSTEHDRFEETTGFDTTVDWTLPDGETIPRYYHIYDPGEFASDLETSDLAVLDRRIVRGNCYARVTGV